MAKKQSDIIVSMSPQMTQPSQNQQSRNVKQRAGGKGLPPRRTNKTPQRKENNRGELSCVKPWKDNNPAGQELFSHERSLHDHDDNEIGFFPVVAENVSAEALPAPAKTTTKNNDDEREVR